MNLHCLVQNVERLGNLILFLGPLKYSANLSQRGAMQSGMRVCIYVRDVLASDNKRRRKWWSDEPC
jgi:hypothetical protein